MAIYKTCLEKSSNDSNKIYQLFARIPYNSYKEDTYHGVPLQQIWMLQANNFSKRTPPQVFFGVRQIFLELTSGPTLGKLLRKN